MKILKQLFLIILLVASASGLSFAQRGHRLAAPAADSAGWRWHPNNERHFDLSDSCWKVFLSELPADTAGMLVGDIEHIADIRLKIDSLRKDFRAARKDGDTILARAIWNQIKDDMEKIRDTRKEIVSIVRKYHALLAEIRRTCDHDGRKGTIGLCVTPVVPNPATTRAHFSYTINASDDVLIQLFDQAGTIARTVFDGQADAGEHDVQLDLTGLQSGAYLIRIQAGPDVNTIKLVIGR